MEVVPFFDPPTCTYSYIVYDKYSLDCVVIDPVLDFDPLSMQITTKSLQTLIAFVAEKKLKVHYIFDTHVHADHLSGAYALSKKINAPFAIGKNITRVQKIFAKVFNLSDFNADGKNFDILLSYKQTLNAGTLSVEVLSTPGHTPTCMTYKINDAMFCGDCLFMPNLGTGRCDFPEGSASKLYESIVSKIYSQTDDTKIFVGHDYPANNKGTWRKTFVGESKNSNIMLNKSTTKEEFIIKREARDRQLPLPKLIYFSLLVNINGGCLPKAESNNQRYFKVPMFLGDNLPC